MIAGLCFFVTCLTQRVSDNRQSPRRFTANRRLRYLRTNNLKSFPNNTVPSRATSGITVVFRCGGLIPTGAS
jgi:hypothetical protein